GHWGLCERLDGEGRTLAPRHAQRDGEGLADTAQVGNTNAADGSTTEPHLGVQVERHPFPSPRRGLIRPRGDQQPKNGQRWTPYAPFPFDQFDVVLLLSLARLDSGDGECAWPPGEVLCVPLVGAWG